MARKKAPALMNAQRSTIQTQLRKACTRLRRTSLPLADLIPLLQRAADKLDDFERVSAMPPGAARSKCPACGYTYGSHAPDCPESIV